MREALLQVILDGLDVVVGDGLDLLDSARSGLVKAVGDPVKEGVGGVAERRQFGNARVGGQRLEPAHLDDHAAVDQAVFAEEGAQGPGLGCVASVDGRQGGQAAQFHAGFARALAKTPLSHFGGAS